MDDPPFYRDDLQAYYDLQISMSRNEPEAVRALKQKFKLRSVTITPTGEVRSPGVVDNPKPPEVPAAPPEGGDGDEPPEGDEPKGDETPGSQMGDEDPHGKDKPKPKDEAGPQLADRCDIPDGVWDEFLRADGDLDEFERWARETYPDVVTSSMLECWEAPDLSEHWRPAHLPAQQGERAREANRLSPARRDLYERFTRLVNMRTGELRAHLRSHDMREMLATSRRSKRAQLAESRHLARHVLRMKALPVQEWDDDLWGQCRKVVVAIERARRNATPLLDERGAPTRKLFALRSLGHNPTVRARITEAEVAPLLEDGRALHRYIDATPGTGLPALVEEQDDAPDFDALKKGKVDLEPAERDQVLGAKAVWHNLPGKPDVPTPAVWRAQVGNRTWYVTNTHRLYNATQTLKGAISRFHRVVKKTA